MAKYKDKQEQFRKIALERVEKLFSEADSMFKEDAKLANRYVSLARKIAMKYRVNIPTKLKRKFCKHCYSYLRPGVNSRVRLYKSKVIIYCSNCKNYTRIPYK